MKEKFKNLFKNKNFWIGLSYSLILIFSTLFSYSKGFVDGVLIDDEIRTELIDSTLDETKKSKIEPKKADTDIVKYSPLDTIGETTKLYLSITEDFVMDFYNSISNIQYDFGYNLYSNDDESIYLNITFEDEQSAFNAYYFDLQIINTYLIFRYGQNQVSDLHYSDDLNSYIDDSMSYDEILNYTGHYISDNKDLIGLNDYYFNATYNDYSYLENQDFTRVYLYTYDIQKPKSFLSEFLTGAVEVVTGFGAVLTASVVSIGSIFYSNGDLTILGSAMALALGIGAIYLLFRMIRGLIKQNNRG